MTTPPPWSRDETLLAMWAATVCGQRVATDDPVVLELSALMRSAAPIQAVSCERFRNPHGVARKVWGFRDLLEGRCGRPLSPIEESVWQEFAKDQRRLAAHAVRARLRLAAAADPPDYPSRGPVPVAFSTARDNAGPSWFYVAALEGIVLASGRIFVKVGHSNDTCRRESDLNFGLPHRLGLRWQMIASWMFPNAMAAYRAEQAVLQSEATAGRSASGEFLLIGTNEVDRLLSRCRNIVGDATSHSSEVQSAR